MKQVAPRIGADEITVAEDQLEFRTVVAAVCQMPDNDPDFPSVRYLVTRWRLSDSERQAIAGGEDFYIRHLTGSGSLQAFAPQVGPEGLPL
jgi:hypothetical protein